MCLYLTLWVCTIPPTCQLVRAARLDERQASRGRGGRLGAGLKPQSEERRPHRVLGRYLNLYNEGCTLSPGVDAARRAHSTRLSSPSDHVCTTASRTELPSMCGDLVHTRCPQRTQPRAHHCWSWNADVSAGGDAHGCTMPHRVGLREPLRTLAARWWHRSRPLRTHADPPPR